MATTVKRISFCLSLEIDKQLQELSQKFGESMSQTIARAIDRLYVSEIKSKNARQSQ